MKKTSAWLAGALGLEAALTSCGGGQKAGQMAWSGAPAVQPAPRKPAETRSVVLVAVDGVRWQEVFGGVDPGLAKQAKMGPGEVVAADRLLPNIYERMVRRGVALGAPGYGEEVRATGPNFISLPGYRELLTGAPSGRCTSNDCPFTSEPTVVDRVREASSRDEDAAVISSWDTLDRAAAARPGQAVVSAGRMAGASRARAGVSERCAALLTESEGVGSWPGEGGYRPDRVTASLALSYLEDARPRFLFVGLGDPDEFAHASDYRSYLGALRFADRFIGDLFALLDRGGAEGAATTVLLTTDHGRAENFHSHGGDFPESARVFLLAAGGSVPALGYVAAGPGRTLSSVTPTVLALLGIDGADRALAEPWQAAGLAPPWQAPAPQRRAAR